MDIPFARFVQFVDAVAEGKDSHLLFEKWARGVPKNLGPAVFRLLFPELDIARRFSFSEPRLAKVLASVLRIPYIQISESSRDTECLGSTIATLVATRANPSSQGLTLSQVDELLTELAALSPWSHRSIRATQKRPEMEILTELYASVGPSTAALLTQLILKSINPLLYPTSPKHSQAFKKPSRTILATWDAMRAWDPRMPSIYRVRADLTIAAQTLLDTDNSTVGPLLGVPIEIPKCSKARSIKDAFQVLSSSNAERAFAEVKYDGERMQIHVDFSKPIREQITIFSKSKRDSTWDRAGTHPIIRAALGRSPDPQIPGVIVPPLLTERMIDKDNANWSKHRAETLPDTREGTRNVKKSVILECEMVAYDELRGRVDEFWRVRNLVETTAIGVRARKAQKEPEPESIPSTSTSSQSNAETRSAIFEPQSTHHLALIFFDILSLDGQSLLERSFEQRRKILEQVIHRIPGWVGLSNGTWINLSDSATDDTNTQSSTASSTHPAHEALIQRFSQVVADYDEGLVVKPCSGPRARCWVKMKKDYIPGLGDCADFVVVGAGFDRERGRELGLGLEVLTTFYIGVRTNEDNLGARAAFDVAFTVSYGLSRDQLEDLNHRIQSTATYEGYRTSGRYMRVPYEVRLASTLRTRPPNLWFLTPMLFELMGAGFTKSEASGHYELRFPRIVKVHSPTDRPWTCGLGARSLRRLARVAIGLEEGAIGTSAEDVIDQIWGGGGGVTDVHERRKERVDKWVKALGGKGAREREAMNDKGGDDIGRDRNDAVDYSSDELGYPSDREGITGDELDSSDMDIWECEEKAKRGYTQIQDDDQDEGEHAVAQANERLWKRLRLAAPGPSFNLGLSNSFLRSNGVSTIEVDHSLSPNGFSMNLETLPDNPTTPARTDSSTSQSSPSDSGKAPDHQRPPTTIRASSLSSHIDPSSLLSDAFIYVVHRSAPHPLNLMPASHRVFSQDALLAGLDWTGARRKRQALQTHIPTNQATQTPRILKGVVIVDHEREDVNVVTKWALLQGTSVHHSMVGKQTNKPVLFVIAPRAKHIYGSNYSSEGLYLDILSVVIPR